MTNVNCDFSLWKEIFSGVPQGSILGPLLFNIYINDIFFFVDEALQIDYADDTELYSVEKNTSLTNLFLRKILCIYRNGSMIIINPGKYYYMTFGLNTAKNEFVLEDGTTVPSAERHVVLEITIDSRLTFYSHLKQLWKKVANELNALTRIAPYISYKQR